MKGPLSFLPLDPCLIQMKKPKHSSVTFVKILMRLVIRYRSVWNTWIPGTWGTQSVHVRKCCGLRKTRRHVSNLNFFKTKNCSGCFTMLRVVHKTLSSKLQVVRIFFKTKKYNWSFTNVKRVVYKTFSYQTPILDISTLCTPFLHGNLTQITFLCLSLVLNSVQICQESKKV